MYSYIYIYIYTYIYIYYIYIYTYIFTIVALRFFSLNTMLRLNTSGRLETIEKHFHLKGYDTMNNPGRN